MKKSIVFFILFYVPSLLIFAQQSIINDLKFVNTSQSAGLVQIKGEPLVTKKEFKTAYRKGTNNIIELILDNSVIDTDKIINDEINYDQGIVKSIQVTQITPKGSGQFNVKISIIGTVPIKIAALNKQDDNLILNLDKITTSNVFPNDISGKLSDNLENRNDANAIEVEKGIKFNPDGSPFDPSLEQKIDGKISNFDAIALFTKIVNAGNKLDKATELGIYLNDLKKYQINQKLGVQFQVTLITSEELNYNKTTIYFRDNFLKHAMFLADIIPGNQRIKRMIEQEKKIGTHIEIYVGKDFK